MSIKSNIRLFDQIVLLFGLHGHLIKVVPLMINNNKSIKEERGNGTKCVGLSVKMKRDCVIDYKNWDGKLVHTVSALDEEYMLCETILENENEILKEFKLKTDKDAATVVIKVGNIKHKVQVKMVQFGVNSNKAKNGHKLQGTTLKRIVVISWSYTIIGSVLYCLE